MDRVPGPPFATLRAPVRLLYLASVWLHVVAVVYWLGGMLFLALVALPALRSEGEAHTSRLVAALGLRFRRQGWMALGVIAITGVVNALGHWGEAPLHPPFWRTTAGVVLAWKLVVVAAMLSLSLAHDVFLGPRLVRADAARAARLRRSTLLLARLNAVLGLVIVALAVWLARV